MHRPQQQLRMGSLAGQSPTGRGSAAVLAARRPASAAKTSASWKDSFRLRLLSCNFGLPLIQACPRSCQLAEHYSSSCQACRHFCFWPQGAQVPLSQCWCRLGASRLHPAVLPACYLCYRLLGAFCLAPCGLVPCAGCISATSCCAACGLPVLSPPRGFPVMAMRAGALR